MCSLPSLNPQCVFPYALWSSAPSSDHPHPATVNRIARLFLSSLKALNRMSVTSSLPSFSTLDPQRIVPHAQCDTRWPPRASPSCCFGLQTAARVFFLCAESEAQAEDFQVAVSLAAASNSGGDATAARHALAQLQALIESSVPIACRFSEVGGMLYHL